MKKLLEIWKFIKKPNHFIAGIAVIFIFTALLFIYSTYENVKKESIEEAKYELKASAEIAANGLEFLFLKYADELSFLSTSRHIIEINEISKDEMRRFYLNQKKTITAVTRINAEGRIVYTYPYDPSVIGKDVSSQAHNAYIIKEHKPVVSDIFLSLQGYETVAFAYPVFSKQNYEGCLSLLIPVKPLVSKYFSGAKVWKNLNVELFTRNGQQIYSNFFVEKDSTLNINELKEGFANFNSLGNKKLIFTKRITLPGNYWYIRMSLPRDSLYQGEKELTMSTYLTIALVVLGITILFMVIIRSRNEKITTIQERDALYSGIAKATGHVIYEYNIDLNRIELFGNSRELIGVDLDEFIAITIEEWWKKVHPDDIGGRIQAISSLKNKKGSFVSRYRMKDIHGNYVTVEDRCVFEKNRKGNYVQRGILRDVSEDEKNQELNKKNRQLLASMVEEKNKELIKINSKLEEQLIAVTERENELKLAKEELLKAKEFVDRFLLMMSDQLKSPTQAMVGLSGMVRDSISSIENAEIVGILKLLLGSIDKTVNSVSLILSAANLISNSYKSYKVECDLELLVFDAVTEYKRKAEEKGLYFKTDFRLEKVKLNTDKVALEVGIRQLLDNAIKFTSEGGVTISVFRNVDDKIVIKIIDTGDGINEDFLRDIFRPFQQESNGYVREKGMGLGLWITKKYFDLGGIDIRLFSEKGKGTTATILIN